MIMTTAPWTHLQRVQRLYKVVLRLHRGLPTEIRELGDVYVKDEFRRHKHCNPAEANVFLNEWADYAINLSEQLGLRGPKTAKTLGKPLDPEDLNKLRDEQVHQLYELMIHATGQAKEDDEKKDKQEEGKKT
ncbi:succinate dehydrogenase assembly factor 3, mitochondrial [Phymastichus coffea]|uniref:succinate dehydrogenase assembly factor 3, mitochondrial n=1 Tax=Phymastichus coffea TaxID=108790 RepID=UPI00273BDF73|nr:succinate dehydrogenase assembly factor 3, mitochondrial [Phymastichus coffea]